jgi:hypothetical protein
VWVHALRSGHGQRTAVVFYAIAFDATALTFHAVWQYARRSAPCSALRSRSSGSS